jgi:hypothetical protein
MYDVNPLGPLMHLKELERQAAPTLHPLRLERQGDSSVTAFSASIISFLRRLQAAGTPRRMVRQDRGAHAGADV